MSSYTLILDETEIKAMSLITENVTEYLQNFATSRANREIEQLVSMVVSKCLHEGLDLPADKAAMVDFALANGMVKTAEQLRLEAEARIAERAQAEAAQQEG